MSFERPPLTEIIRRGTSDFEYELGSQAPRLPGTVEHAFVRAGAGVAHGLHGRLDRVRRDAFWATSSDEELIRKAALFGVFHVPATRSDGYLVIFGDNGTPIPVGTVFQREDGISYETTVGAVIDGAGFTLPPGVPARALTSGAVGNVALGTNLVIQSPTAGLTGVATTVLGANEWLTGADAESTASLRRRLALRLASPPKGGGPGDYVRWALGGSDADKVPPGATPPAGVTRAWEYGKVPKVGNVTVLIMCDDDDDPFPSPAKLEEVKQWIMLFAPIAFPDPEVIAPNEKVVDIEITLTTESNADLPTVKAAIVESIKNMIAVRATPPKDGLSVFYKSWFNEAISKTPGELDHKLLNPVGDIPLAQWDLVTLGVVTWT
jgi:uncharacterized phage protein gp47/JayE